MDIKKIIKNPVLISIISIIVIVAIVLIITIIIKSPEPPLPKEVYGLSGTITRINKASIKIDAIVIFEDGTQTIKSRKILIDENTIISKLDFSKDIPKKTKIDITDLEKGSKVEILGYENIQGEKTFLGKTIDVLN